MSKKILLPAYILFIFLVLVGFTLSADVEVKKTPPARAGEEINWQVISGGGGKGNSTSYILSGTIGQTAVDEGISAGYILKHGYWQNFVSSGACDCVPGEANNIVPINILDIVYIINYKYKSGPASVPYEFCNSDPDANCVVNILDIVYLINFKYKSGSEPATCQAWVSACGALH